ncbi:MAG TPA: serine/threonine-protein kinase, partial [Polyangiaceae bacterium]|nr:serine/threonine-protein kinase [Polyangiaceae bacterium]
RGTMDDPRSSRPDETQPETRKEPSAQAEEGQAPAAPQDPYIGKTIDGRYLVEAVLGEGGMGVVYRGRHKVIDKKVAIKVLRGEMASDTELTERFLQEARAASAIGNPHIIDISDFGQLPDGLTYFVMELLEGKNLSAAIAATKGPMPPPRIYAIAKQIAEALAAAHAANIIHRDLKPDNVMLVNRGQEKDFVKILDFGIAKVGGGSKKVTRAGSVFGTPHYMSPEQAAGAVVDHRTDIYALGVILYELASARVPFDADNFMGILTQHMYKAPVPIRALVPEVDVPPGLDAVVLKCLTKKPEGRYASMGELLLDLEKLERGVLPDAVSEMMARSGGFNVPADYFRSAMPAPVPATPSMPPKSRGPVYTAVGGGAAVLAGLVAIGLAMRGGAHDVRVETTVVPPTALVAPPVAPPLPKEPVTAAAPPPAPVASTEVLMSVVPGDATIKRGNQDLGTSPVALHLAPGESAVLEVSRKGFKPTTVTVDGSQAKQVVALESIAVPAAPRPATPVAPKRPAAGPGIGDDVGDPFAAKK